MTKTSRPLSYIAMALSALMIIVGVVFAGMYVVDGVIATRGEVLGTLNANRPCGPSRSTTCPRRNVDRVWYLKFGI